MAEVHLAATSIVDGVHELVVVKRMHTQHLEDTATVRMFLDEARLALRLEHRHIVRTHRLGMFDGRHGIVMEFLEGQPLQHVLKRAYETEHTVSLEAVAMIGIAALDGLHHAHELRGPSQQPLGIVHRDVSPQNLFITYEGTVKLLDFGIAKNAMQEGRTRTGLLKGKISYMAPEQARGDAIDRRADVWSLGVMLWEAVCGTRLFKGSNEAATLNMTLTEEVKPPSLRRADIPADLEAILMRALQRDCALRYPTAAAMRDDLTRWLAARPAPNSKLLSELMQRLFATEVAEQRDKIDALLSQPPEPSAESGVTLIAPAISFSSGTVSGMRATQVSSVTDLVEELTRQRRATTRLLGLLVAIVGVAALVALYLLSVRREPLERASAASLAPAVPIREAAPPSAPVASAVAAPTVISLDEAAPAPRLSGPRAPASTRWPRVNRPASSRQNDQATASSALAHEDAKPTETGFLNLDTTPWSVVSVGGRVLGQTPIVGATLPVGSHALVLTNPELGLRTTYQVTISAGRTTARRVGLD